MKLPLTMCFAHCLLSHAGKGRGQSAMELPTADGADDDEAGVAAGPGGGGGGGACDGPSVPGPGLLPERLVPRIRALLEGERQSGWS